MKLVTAAAMAVGLLSATSAFAAPNLIQNGDFETPIVDTANPGFATDYTYATGPNSMQPEGAWTVGTNPIAVHNSWIDLGNSTNNMLILNGKTSGLPSTAWSQDVDLLGGTYAFSFQAMNICCNDSYGGENLPSLLSFDFSTDGVNFTNLASVMTDPALPDVGQFYTRSGSFSTGAGTVRISIRNQAGAFGGNDFAVDNISLAAVPEPATWAMMIMGFGFAGSALRRQRKLALA